MGEAENSHAEAHNLGGRPQADRRSAADEVGESESQKVA